MGNDLNEKRIRAHSDTIVRLTAELVQIASRADRDSPQPIVDFLTQWLERQGASPVMLRRDGRTVGFYVHVSSGSPGPTLCLDACLDTAPYGNESDWHHPPLSGTISGGRLYGRGSADSKVAAAIFAHVVLELARDRQLLRGDLYLLCDVDEHTGAFGGITTFLERLPSAPDAVVIGYPGNYGIVVGARGFVRARVKVFGNAGHSGSKRAAGINAVSKAAELVASIDSTPLPLEPDPSFDFGPRVTVTAMHGGESFSQVPDQCECAIDIRLTPNFGKEPALEWLRQRVAILDEGSSSKATQIEIEESWPAYRLAPEEPIVRCLGHSARAVFGRDTPPVVCGPSNIGNLLATKAIPAVCGFGVSYQNIHAVDEHIELDTIVPVYQTYLNAVRDFLGGDNRK